MTSENQSPIRRPSLDIRALYVFSNFKKEAICLNRKFGV